MPISGDLSIGQDIENLELPSANDLEILRAIGDDIDARELSFQGIRRKLGVHQETLSRALHRLQRDGYVERLEHAYKVSLKGMNTILSGDLQSKAKAVPDPYSVVLLSAILPNDLNVQKLIDSLSFKWFGNLRWLGSTMSAESATLSWITSETGLKISVRIRGNAIAIETYPIDSGSIAEATRSAFDLFDHISRALRSSEKIEGTRYTTAS